MDQVLKRIEESLASGKHENVGRVNHVVDEVSRIQEVLTKVSAEFEQHKRQTDHYDAQLQQQVSLMEDKRKRQLSKPSNIKVTPSMQSIAPTNPGLTPINSQNKLEAQLSVRSQVSAAPPVTRPQISFRRLTTSPIGIRPRISTSSSGDMIETIPK